MSAENRRRITALLVWAAYFVIPSDAGGLVGGLPLGPIEAAALLAIGWLALYRERLPMAALAAAAMIATTAAGIAIPGTNGFRARYFATADATGAPERSPGFTGRAFTRVDERLHFAPGGPELPLNFFNDNTRFGFFDVRGRDRNKLEFSVRWSGEFWVSGRVDALYVQAPGATGAIFVDGALAASVGPADEDGESVEPLSAPNGWHRLDVTLSSPYGAPRRFSAGTVVAGVRRPFDSREVVTQEVRDWQMTAARLLRIVRTVCDVAALAWVFGCLTVAVGRRIGALRLPATDRERRGQVMALFAALVAIDAWRVAWPWATRVMMLVGGDDTLTYETFARDILFNGILMSGGKPLGQGDPFYYQAFYPYFLAATHAIFGEFMFGAVLVQRLLAALAIFKLVEITVRYTAERAWIVALPVATAFIAWKFWHIADQPLNESLYVPLLAAATAATIRLCDQPDARGAIWSGILSGFTTITRSTALVAWAMVWPAVWVATKNRPERARLLALLIASFLAVFSLVAVRNFIVAGVPSPMPTEGAITLLGGNEPPPGLTIDPGRQRIYERLGISDLATPVIEYAIQQPGLFALHQGRKALFVLGIHEFYAPGWGYSPVYLLNWITAMAGIWLVANRRQGSVWITLIPALIALTQFIAIVIIYPKGERLIVPVHIMLVPYTAAAVWFAVNRRSSEAANASLIPNRTNT